MTGRVDAPLLDARRGAPRRFWDAELRTELEQGESPLPSFVVVPPDPGTALLFVGSVFHAAMAVTSGERLVLVASFGPV